MSLGMQYGPSRPPSAVHELPAPRKTRRRHNTSPPRRYSRPANKAALRKTGCQESAWKRVEIEEICEDRVTFSSSTAAEIDDIVELVTEIDGRRVMLLNLITDKGPASFDGGVQLSATVLAVTESDQRGNWMP